jgi:hypothetical protein
MAEELGEEVGVRDVPVDGVDPGAREESRAATLERGVVVAVEVVEAEHAVPSAAQRGGARDEDGEAGPEGELGEQRRR